MWTTAAGARSRAPIVKAHGFTIIELMVAVLVVAILAALAYPSYQDQIRKGRRGAAQALLVEIGSRQQQYLLDARRYAVGAGALATLNVTVPVDVAPFYTITVEPAAPTVPPSYQLIATPVAGSVQEPDGVLTLDHNGARTRKGNPGW